MPLWNPLARRSLHKHPHVAVFPALHFIYATLRREGLFTQQQAAPFADQLAQITRSCFGNHSPESTAGLFQAVE
jgi:hypothetical protein